MGREIPESLSICVYNAGSNRKYFFFKKLSKFFAFKSYYEDWEQEMDLEDCQLWKKARWDYLVLF